MYKLASTQVVSGFPSFSSYSADLHFLTYQGSLCEPAVGIWPSSAFEGGIKGGNVTLIYICEKDKHATPQGRRWSSTTRISSLPSYLPCPTLWYTFTFYIGMSLRYHTCSLEGRCWVANSTASSWLACRAWFKRSPQIGLTQLCSMRVWFYIASINIISVNLYI